MVREGPRPWEECTCPERLGTRWRPAAEAPARCPSPAAQCRLGLGKAGDRPPRKTCPCVQFPARGTDTNNNNSTSRRPGGEESFWPAPEWRQPKAGRCYARQEGDTVGRRGTTGGLRGQDRVQGAVPGRRTARDALSKVQGRRLVRGRRGARADTSPPEAKRAENSCAGRRTPPARKSAGARGAAAKGAGGSPAPLPSSLTSSSAPLPPRPLLSVPCPRAAAGAGPGAPHPRTASPDAPGMLRAAEPLTWGHGAEIQDKRARGAARLLLASASPPDPASAGLRPGLRAARRGQTAAAARAAAAAADRGRPVAAGSLCE